MKKIDPKQVASAWAQQPILKRLDDCRRMLSIWGVLTDAESARVTDRLRRAAAGPYPVIPISQGGGAG
jgi:hypothetical protein